MTKLNMAAYHLKLFEWPEAERMAWLHGCAPGDPFDDPRPGATQRQATLKKRSSGYGHWLSFLVSRGWFDTLECPLERVTRPRLRAYFHAMKDAGYADYTIIGLFADLQAALRILMPEEDVSWVTKPDGATIYSLLPKKRRPMIAPDSGVLFAWTIDIMDQAMRVAEEKSLAVFRDGLFMAMLASRGRRLRSMALLRVSRELLRRGDVYVVELTAQQVKTGKSDRFAFPDVLTPYIQHYLDVVRTALLAGRIDEAVWIGGRGDPMTAKQLAAQVHKWTERRFAQGFGPHRFRHAIATTAVLRDPGCPGLAAGLLGISPQIVERHYDLAGQSSAAKAYAALIARKRRDLDRAAVRDTQPAQ